MLFKWFVDLNIMEPAFDASSLSRNGKRLREHEVARQLLNQVLEEARRRALLLDDLSPRLPTEPTRSETC